MILAKPVTASVDLVDKVVAERTREPNKTFFAGIAREWRQRVDDYVMQAGSPEHVPTWPAIAGNAKSFKNLYSHPADGSSQGEMLKILRAHELDICPACGAPTVPETLDHYLPKGKYPHFSVTPVNLTPMCDPCQRRKCEKTGDQQTPRFFIHPYFDAFSIEQIVCLQINAPFTTPTFSLFSNPGLTAAESVLVDSHLRELEISRRYVRFFRNEWRRLIRNVAKMRAKGLDVVDNIETWQTGYADPTPNGWHHLFYAAVTENAVLVDYLENDFLPTYP